MTNKKFKLNTLLLLGIGLTGIQAQTSVNASGGVALGSGGSSSYSIGQVVYITQTGTNGSVTQGVQQPYVISITTSIEQAKDITLLTYPNPTTDYLVLKVTDFELSDMNFQLFDKQGKLLQSDKITSNQTNISMSNLLPDIYFVKVVFIKSQGIAHQQEIKTFKIIKK